MKIRIPKGFLNDHEDRALPTPVYKSYRGGYLIDTDDPNFAELVDDAKYYAEDVDACSPGVIRAARAFLKAITPNH